MTPTIRPNLSLWACDSVKSAYFEGVQATLTDLRRHAGKLLAAVLHRGKTVQLTQHGKRVARIQPTPQPLSVDEFSRLWRQRPKLDKATADEVARNIAERRRAECSS